jgi:hypothetical protein
VPFTPAASEPDASIVSVFVDVVVADLDADVIAPVAARARYATNTDFDPVAASYANQFPDHDVFAAADAIEYRDTSSATERFDIRIDYRIITYTQRINNYDGYKKLVDSLSGWDSNTPVPREQAARAVSVSTVNRGRTIAHDLNLTNSYTFALADEQQIRSELEQLLDGGEWDWREPRADVIYADGPLDLQIDLSTSNTQFAISMIANLELVAVSAPS